jgi:hypothetical protein
MGINDNHGRGNIRKDIAYGLKNKKTFRAVCKITNREK